jgi:SAM-dependent methyltransferase
MDQEKIWDYFQNNQEIGDLAFHAESRYRYLCKQIEPGQEILNIGVGRGGLEKLLIEKKVKVSCLDPSEKSIHNLQFRFGLQERARVGFSQNIPFEDSVFDVVVASEVLEHLRDEIFDRTLLEIHRVLRPGGKFIGSLPADENLMVSHVVCPECGENFHRWGHVQSFSKERLYTKMTAVFTRVEIKRKYFENFRSLNWKGRLVWIVKKLLILSGVQGKEETFFFSARKSQ